MNYDTVMIMNERAKRERRERFLEWCKETGQDPQDQGAWDTFSETEYFWEDMDEDNLKGWTDNMNKTSN